MVTFTVFGLIFLCFGVTLYIMSENIQEVVIKYNERIECENTPVGETCILTFDVAEKI
jgi:hypothetical protein